MARPAESPDQTRHTLASYVAAAFADIIEKNESEATIPERSHELSRLHAELVRSETSLAEAQSIARIGSWEVDLVTNHVSWSRELYRLFDFGLDEEPSHEALIERTHPDDQASTIEAIVTAMEDFTPFVIEHRLLLSDGTIRWIPRAGGSKSMRPVDRSVSMALHRTSPISARPRRRWSTRRSMIH